MYICPVCKNKVEKLDRIGDEYPICKECIKRRKDRIKDILYGKGGLKIDRTEEK